MNLLMYVEEGVIWERVWIERGRTQMSSNTRETPERAHRFSMSSTNISPACAVGLEL